MLFCKFDTKYDTSCMIWKNLKNLKFLQFCASVFLHNCRTLFTVFLQHTLSQICCCSLSVLYFPGLKPWSENWYTYVTSKRQMFLFFSILHPYCRFYFWFQHPLFRRLHTQLQACKSHDFCQLMHTTLLKKIKIKK